MDDQIEEQIKQPKTKSRKIIIALLLSFLTPGLGQMYNGQIIKGAYFLISLFLINIIFGFTKVATSFNGLIISIFINLIFVTFIIIDAIKNAIRNKEYVPKKYNKWGFYVLIVIIYIMFIQIFNGNTILGIKPLKIANDSSSPTLEIGDNVVVDLKAYKKNNPNYGDIVAFKYNDGSIWTFRVIGLPNDILDITDNNVSINSKKCNTTFIEDTTVEDYQIGEYEETLPNGHKHRIYINEIPFDSTKSNMKNIIVPEDKYFLLGDNRDGALDSRYIGSINKKDIIGKMVYCLGGKGLNRYNISLRDK